MDAGATREDADADADARRRTADTVVTGARGVLTACVILSRDAEVCFGARFTSAHLGHAFCSRCPGACAQFHRARDMADDAPQSLDELVANLATYKEQLNDVDELLKSDPTNAEFSRSSPPRGGHRAHRGSRQGGWRRRRRRGRRLRRRRRAAAAAAAADALGAPVGTQCRARFDGVWYDAVVDGVNETNGRIKVTFTQYGTVAELDADDIKGADGGAEGVGGGGDDDGAQLDPVAAAAAREVYKGVPAPKRVRVDGDADRFVKKELPKKLMIMDGDDEATRERKRRQIKAFKGKQRMAEMDAEQNAKKNSWQSFQAKAGSKKRTGFMTGKVGKKDSMFRVPEGGRVGVVGSGQGVTDYSQKKRYDQ